MRFKYGKYSPSPLDDLDMDELMSKLSDLLLSSGFNDPYFSGSEDERSMQALYDAILEALLSGGVLPEETLKQLLGDQAVSTAFLLSLPAALIVVQSKNGSVRFG